MHTQDIPEVLAESQFYFKPLITSWKCKQREEYVSLNPPHTGSHESATSQGHRS